METGGRRENGYAETEKRSKHSDLVSMETGNTTIFSKTWTWSPWKQEVKKNKKNTTFRIHSNSVSMETGGYNYFLTLGLRLHGNVREKEKEKNTSFQNRFDSIAMGTEQRSYS